MPKRGLTQAAVEKRKPHPDKRIEVADYGSGSKPGLYLVIQKSSQKSWALRYRFNGKSRKLTLGPATLGVARKVAQDRLDEITKGIDPALVKKQSRNRRSSIVDDLFCDFQARYIRKRGGLPIRASTRMETGRLLGVKPVNDDLTEWEARDPYSGVLAKWHGKDIELITKDDVMSLVEDIAERPAPIAANRTLSALKSVFRWLVQRNIIEASPAEYIDDPSPEEPKGRRLTDKEIGAIYKAAKSDGVYGKFVQILLLVGQRRGEVLKATWDQIDLQRKTWTIPGENTKNGKTHLVPLSDHAVSILREILSTRSRKSGLIFTETGVPLSNLSRRKARLEADIDHWRLHDCRHTLKTWMQEQRIPEDIRDAVQNHSGGDMDARYGHHTFEDEKRDALDRWAAHVLSCTENRA
jgi:integrase